MRTRSRRPEAPLSTARFRLPRAGITALALIAATVAALSAGAETVEVDGARGANGAPGASGTPPEAGSPGEDGESVSAVADEPADLRNRAVARGGNGGNGGAGGDAETVGETGAPGGAGGNGGDASALAVTRDGEFVRAEAYGGGPGFGGMGGAGVPPGGFGPRGPGGEIGGDAVADATLETELDATTPFSNLNGSALAEGGGGRPVGGDATATVRGEVDAVGVDRLAIGLSATAKGGSSGGAATAQADGTTNAGSLEVSATATGGSSSSVGDLRQTGGAEANAVGLHTGSGSLTVRARANSGGFISGNEDADTQFVPGALSATASGVATAGADVEVSAVLEGQGPLELRDAVSGSTSGSLTLSQEVRGELHNIEALGRDAVTSLTATNPGGGDLSVSVRATGANAAGGDPSSVSGGDARVDFVHATGEANVSVEATARGGNGIRDRGAPEEEVGAGGAAEIGSVFGRSTGGGSVEVTASVFGASDSNREGASVELVDVVDGETSGDLVLNQQATAGRLDIIGEARGDAASRLDVSRSARSLSIDSSASGAISEASASASNDAGSVEVSARAVSTVGAGPSGRDGGTATASARGETSGDGHQVTVRSRFGANAVGGAGAGTIDDAPGGRGGDATSTSVGVAEGESQVQVSDAAQGGAGGGAAFFSAPADAVGGRGGDASSSATGRNAGAARVDLFARAQGGKGGEGAREEQIAGRGGDAVASGRGESTGGAEVTVLAEATGGEGGAVGTAPVEGEGRGGDASLGELSGSSAGLLTLQGSVEGGRGGRRTSSFSETVHLGRGGDAIVDVDAVNEGGGELAIEIEARAQDGGRVILENLRGRSSNGAAVSVDLDVDVTGAGLGPEDPGDPRVSPSLFLIDAVDGETTGVLELSQKIQGGDEGGVVHNELRRSGSHAGLTTHTEAVGRSGASARAFSDATNATGWARAESQAAGAGGREALSEARAIGAGDESTHAFATSSSGRTGTGAESELTQSLAHAVSTGGGNVFAAASSTASNGGITSANAYGQNAGAGGVEVESLVSSFAGGSDEIDAVARGVSTGGGDVEVSALVFRRDDELPLITSLNDAVSGSTTGVLTLSQSLFGTGDLETSLVAENDGGGDLGLRVLASSEGHRNASGDFEYGVLTLGDVVGRSDTGARVDVELEAIGDRLELVGGGAAGRNRVFGGSNGGDVSVRSHLTQFGSLDTTETATEVRGGAGRSFAQDNYAEGETTGRLSLSQGVVAGDGETLFQPSASPQLALGGEGGEATSRLTRSGSFAGLELEVEAQGGFGGFVGGPGAGTRGGDGGMAHGAAEAENDTGAATVGGLAAAGAGGFSAERAGDGGDALLELRATTRGDGHAVVVGSDAIPPPFGGVDAGARGGGGGDATGPQFQQPDENDIAGSGGSARSRSEGQALGNSEVSVFAVAQGGAGGDGRRSGGNPGGSGGEGGSADAEATAIGSGTARVASRARALGGAGGFALQSGSEGGDASASAFAQGLGEVDAEAIATGGTSSDPAGPAGGAARALAEARGASGRALADVGILDQLGPHLRTRVTRDVAEATIVEASAAHATALADLGPTRPSETLGNARLVGAPVAADIDWAASSHAGLAALLGGEPGAEVAALGEWRGRAANAQPDHQVTEFDITLAEPENGGELLLAVFATEVASGGFDQLDFSIEIDGELFGETQSFAGLDEANEFFASLVSLGSAFLDPFSSDASPVARVLFDVTMTEMQSVGFGIAVVVVPEPSTFALLAIGLALLAVHRSRGRSSRS